jgi:hypothetical protein
LFIIYPNLWLSSASMLWHYSVYNEVFSSLPAGVWRVTPFHTLQGEGKFFSLLIFIYDFPFEYLVFYVK